MKHTQTGDILKYLQTHKSGITQKQAFELFGAMRLSGLIFDLKKRGHNISSNIKPVKNRYGGTSLIATYVLED